MKYPEIFTMFLLCIPILAIAQNSLSFDNYFHYRTMRIDFHHSGDAHEEWITLDHVYDYGTWAGSWAVWGGGTATLSDKSALNVQLAYDDADNFSAVGNVEYQLVPGLRITPEIGYGDNFDDDEDGQFGGYLRFQRDW